MAIDFLVGALLVCSASVNLLALGAFWVTPSLRNGLANRFVVNLLICNLVCCIILAPSLLLNSLTFSTVVSPTVHDAVLPPPPPSPPSSPSVQTFVQLNTTDCKLNSNCTNILVQAPTDEIQSEFIQDKYRFTEIRCWGLDFAAAVGALSVLLVVGDTWCAVTDPLRYHTRLSDKKAWGLVFLAWAIGILFGIASAFRSDQTNAHVMNEPDDVYNAIFSYTYFFFAILTPFCMVCTMYWRIYSEARESGQRMRQNGSSPLLQSALNLAQVSAATAQQQTNSLVEKTTTHDKPNTGCGITMKIDTGALSNNLCETLNVNSNRNSNASSISFSNNNNNNNDNNNENSDEKEETVIEPLLATNNQVNTNNLNNLNYAKNNNSNCMKVLRRASDEHPSFSLHIDNKPYFQSDSNQNNLLLSLPSSVSTEQIRRNFSAKHLVIENLDDNNQKLEIRHASSTPNLHKLDKYDMHPQLVLPLPTVNVPPKALSYMTSIRHRLSNASSLFKYREESRAARISILVVVMFLVSYLPYGILVLMQGHNNLLDASDQSLLAIFAVVLANLSSPFIFAYRNKRVRRGIFRLLGVDKQKANERFQKFQNSTIRRKTTSFINRSASRASTYSGNSCKYLTVTQHSTAVTLNGSYIVEIDKLSPCFEEKSSMTASPVISPLNIVPVHSPIYKQPNNNGNAQTGDYKIKKSILKRVRDTSKIWGCNCAVDTKCADNNNKISVTQPAAV